MWGLVVYGAIIVGNYLYHRWTDEKPKLPDERFASPRVEEGPPIPIVYGRCRVRAPALVWSGNHLTPRDGADHYAVDMLMAIGVPFFRGRGRLADGGQTRVGGMWAGDVPLPVSLPDLDRPVAFIAGDFGGGSTAFTVTGAFFDGGTRQNANQLTAGTSPSTFLDGVSYSDEGQSTSLISAIAHAGFDPTLAPKWRGYMMAWMHVALGNTPQIPNLSFKITALSTGSNADMGNSLPEDADPAAVIYDLLTSPWGKLGLPESSIDRRSFAIASAALFNEQHGYSRVFDQREDASTIIQDVLRQIDGTIFPDPATGRITLRLVRQDYDINDLDDINPDNATLDSYSVQGATEVYNKVALTWTNRAENYAQSVTYATNGASILSQGGRVRQAEVVMLGCCTEALAKQLAAREAAVRSRPMVKATVITNRSFHARRPGDVVTMTWPALGIRRMVMRIAQADFGTLLDGRITFDLLSDIFDRRLAVRSA